MLRDLPAVELARLTCVHKAYLVGWRSLQKLHPWRRYPQHSAKHLEWTALHCHSRLERAAALGNVAVIRAMLAAGVDEHGAPLVEASNQMYDRLLDATVHADGDGALRLASENGHAAVVLLLQQHGALLPNP